MFLVRRAGLEEDGGVVRAKAWVVYVARETRGGLDQLGKGPASCWAWHEHNLSR